MTGSVPLRVGRQSHLHAERVHRAGSPGRPRRRAPDPRSADRRPRVRHAEYRFWTGRTDLDMVQTSHEQQIQLEHDRLALALTAEVDVRTERDRAYEKCELTYVLAHRPCTTPGLIGSPAGAAPTGATVTYRGPPQVPDAQLPLLDLASRPALSIVQDYGTSNTFSGHTVADTTGSRSTSQPGLSVATTRWPTSPTTSTPAPGRGSPPTRPLPTARRHHHPDRERDLPARRPYRF